MLPGCWLNTQHLPIKNADVDVVAASEALAGVRLAFEMSLNSSVRE